MSKRTDQMFLKLSPEVGREIRKEADRDIRPYTHEIEWLLRFALCAKKTLFGNRSMDKVRQEVLAAMGEMA